MIHELLDHFDLNDPGELEILTAIKDSIKRNPKDFVYRLDQEIYEACMKHEICPECFARLAIEPYTNIYIVQGETFRERTTRAICPECGWRG